jgi:DNA-binding transcriptional MerR regulator
VFDQLRDQFKNPDDPFEYVPTKLRALKARNGKVQESATGYYPHAGLLSMFHYLRRYPTTETNRNRLRARMYYQHFLGVDIMKLAPRVTDAAAVTAKYEIPTMQAPDCVVCHKIVDPVAGLFQDYNAEGHLGPRKEGWYTDMFGPGFEGETLSKTERWRALQWLGERTAKDPRFATAMVEHVYYILMGRKVLQAPEDIDDPMFASKRRAYEEQQKLIAEVAQRFRQAGFNLKVVFKALIASQFYRADGLATLARDPRRRAELDDIGLVHLLTPEQLERKIKAVFGQKWGRLDSRESQFKILYGGIDSKAVTERITEPSGAMGAIQRIMANDVACKNVALDFSREPAQRLLFPHIELDVLPGDGPEAETRIRQAIVYLHEHLLGRPYPIDHPEVERTYRLFVGIINDAKEARGIDKRGSYSCDRVDNHYLGDPNYTLRAWRGVVTYLLRQQDFLYE